MATLKRFEELKAWQKARELTRAVYSCSKVGAFAKDFGLRDQIRRVDKLPSALRNKGREVQITSDFRIVDLKVWRLRERVCNEKRELETRN